MTRSKLSDVDRQEILTLYRESAETTSALAERYGVSGTTIRRVLKGSLSQQEDEALTRQKQAPRLTKLDQTSHLTELGPSEVKLPDSPLLLQRVHPEKGIVSVPPKEAPAVIGEPTIIPYLQSQEDSDQPSSLQLASVEPRGIELPFTKPLRKRSTTSVTVANQPTITQAKSKDTVIAVDNAEILGATGAESPTSSDFDPVDLYGSDDPEDFKELEEELDSLEDDDEDFEDDLEAAPMGEKTSVEGFVHSRDLHVLPFSEAAIPKTCYLVIDRSAELITRPLKDFGDLGQIPVEEIQERTLPIFDNHRVARRFSNRTQRVIKIPDGDMLQKACSHLHSKGITRMLINGQVYSL